MADHTTLMSQHWTDILPLPGPAAMGWWWILSAVSLALLVVLVVALLWQQRPRQRALRQLRRCQRQLQSLSVETRDIAYRTYRAVMQGLAVRPLTASSAGVVGDPRWRAFYRQLQACVYAGRSPSRAEVADLIRQGRDWLRHHPG